jgi:hypothetical protein
MQAMKCDRCGKFYDYYSGSKGNFKDSNGIILIDMDLGRNYLKREIYNFCPDCLEKLKDFLDGEVENGGDE